MLADTDESRKLLHIICNVDKRKMNDFSDRKFFQHATSFTILKWVKENLGWPLNIKARLYQIAQHNISIGSLKYIENTYTLQKVRFVFNSNNIECIEYLTNKGYKKRICGKKVIMSVHK